MVCADLEKGEGQKKESETREIGDKVKKVDRIEDKKRLGEWRNIPPTSHSFLTSPCKNNTSKSLKL